MPQEAEKKFWRTPELVDRLITTFLDSKSTLTLVKALPLALQVIKGKSSWIKLVRRVCPYDVPAVCLNVPEREEQLAMERKVVMNLVDILKMMELEDPSPLLLDLLHVICKNFPPVDRDDVPVDVDEVVNEIPGPEFIQVSCTCDQTSHDLNQYGFLYLEEVEWEAKRSMEYSLRDYRDERCAK